VLPGVLYRQNRYTTAVFSNIVHSIILIRHKYIILLRSPRENGCELSETDHISQQAPKSTHIGSVSMHEITTFMIHDVYPIMYIHNQIR